LEEAVETHHIKYAAQKARKKAEAKMREEVKKQRIVEEEEKKKWMEYLQQLWDKVLVEDATFLESTGDSQVTGTKHKEVNSEDKEEQWPSKKAKGKKLEKYHGDAKVKIGGANPCERCVCARQDCLVYNSR